MSGPDENDDNSTPVEKFLAAEYRALIDIDASRNDRLDRFLTIFMTLTAAPWALYALVLKEHTGVPSFSATPPPVATVFVLIGILGALVAMMYIQLRFNIILYTRALNAIRGRFLPPKTLAFQLPGDPKKPRYFEGGTYIQYAVAAMALVNSGYIGFGLYCLIDWPHCFGLHVSLFVLVGIACWIGHMNYYSTQAAKREGHGDAPVLRWNMPTAEPGPGKKTP